MLDKIDSGDDSESVMLDDVTVYQPKEPVFPEDGLHKIDLANYYDIVAPRMLPHIKDRALSLEPHNTSHAGRPELIKKLGEDVPDYVIRLPVFETDGTSQEILLCQNVKTLIYLTDQNLIAYYGTLSRFDKPALPDKMVINLDPPDVTYFEETVEAAFLLKELFEDANMRPYVMTTGSRGLHVVCPLRRNRGFDRVQSFLNGVVAKAMERRPDLVTTGADKGERIRLDISSNAKGGESIIPYSIRAMAHAPIATPLAWDELESSDMHPQRFTVATIGARLSAKKDVWENFYRHKRKLTK